jgi:hypothetical protein
MRLVQNLVNFHVDGTAAGVYVYFPDSNVFASVDTSLPNQYPYQQYHYHYPYMYPYMYLDRTRNGWCPVPVSEY